MAATAHQRLRARRNAIQQLTPRLSALWGPTPAAPQRYPERVPELPEVDAARRLLEPVMRAARFERVLLRRPDLRRPFPADFAARLTGTTVEAVERRAKYLVLPLSSRETLVMHLGMSGHFSVLQHAGGAGLAGPAAGPHDHVVFEMSSGHLVTFTDPRRFGTMDLLTPEERLAHPTLADLGPEPLSTGFDAAALARACARRKAPLKVVLLDQRAVAGLGNIYAVEALHRAGLSPSRRASSIATPTGKPRPSAERLAVAIKKVLTDALTRQAGRSYRTERFRVYDREGEACPTRGCSGIIGRSVQGGRSTFSCSRCQR
jgi:formamidopyrimidine-DNA glycosylase